MNVEKVTNIKQKSSAFKKVGEANFGSVSHAKFEEIKDTTSFTGNPAAKASAEIMDELLGVMPKAAGRMVKVHKWMGEIQNQIINALGTGLVAPVFIKYNPLSDTDENTRTYTAWRQPVSAVLAVCTQAAIVKPFNDLIKWMSDIGGIGQKYNASLFPSESRIKSEIKAENPNKKFTKDELKAEIKARQARYDKALDDMILEDRVSFRTLTKDGFVEDKMPEGEFKKLFSETLDNIIKEEEKERTRAITVKQPKMLERSVFYHNYPGETKQVLQRVSDKITDLNALAGDDDAIVCKEIKKEFRDIIKELKADTKGNPEKAKVNEQLIEIVKELRDKITDRDPSSVKILDEKTTHMINEVDKMAAKKSTSEVGSYVKGIIDTRTNAIDGVVDTLKDIKTRLDGSGITVKEAQAIIDNKIAESSKAVEEALRARGLDPHNTFNIIPELSENVGARLEQNVKKLAGNIRRQLKNNIKANIEGATRWTGLAVSLAILPVTCWMLNKIYPWFMDKAFPELSNKQGKKAPAQENKVGGDK